MNDLTCAEIADLLPAYVLDAMDGDERCALMEHLAECRLHDADLQAEREAAIMLSEVIPPVAPPSTLRSSLLDAFDKEVAGGIASEPETTLAPAPTPIRPREVRKPFWQSLGTPGFAYGLAAALAVIAIALGAWGVTRNGDSGEGGVRLATARENNQRLDVTYLPDRDLAVVNFDMPALPSGRTYQAWHITDGKPVSLGVLAQTSGTVTFAANLDKASAVAISIEPAGGSAQPTQVAIASPFS
jgi:anti-sigma-K factor RskA